MPDLCGLGVHAGRSPMTGCDRALVMAPESPDRPGRPTTGPDGEIVAKTTSRRRSTGKQQYVPTVEPHIERAVRCRRST